MVGIMYGKAGGTMCVSRDPGLDGEMHGAMSDVYRQHSEVMAALKVSLVAHVSCGSFVECVCCW